MLEPGTFFKHKVSLIELFCRTIRVINNYTVKVQNNKFRRVTLRWKSCTIYQVYLIDDINDINE